MASASSTPVSSITTLSVDSWWVAFVTVVLISSGTSSTGALFVRLSTSVRLGCPGKNSRPRLAIAAAPASSPILSSKIARFAVAGAWSGLRSRQIWNACRAPRASCCASRRTPRLNHAISLDGSKAIALLKATSASCGAFDRDLYSPSSMSDCTCSSTVNSSSERVPFAGSSSASATISDGVSGSDSGSGSTSSE